MPPRISVVMPSYNHASYVAEAACSVLAQSVRDLELIVIDDGSSDRSGAILSGLAADDARIRLVARSNKGAPASLNEGIGLAGGEWIAIVNSDDAYAPDRLHVMVQALEARGAAWGFSRVGFIDEKGAPARPGDVDWYRRVQADIARWPTVGFALLRHNVTLTTGNFVFRRCLFDAAGAFRDLQLVHDWDFALRLLRQAEPHFVDAELYFYRLHGANTIRSIAQATTDREVGFILRDFLLAVAAQKPVNALAPSPHAWPGYFEAVLQSLDFQGLPYAAYLPSAQDYSFLAKRSIAQRARSS